MLGLPVHRRADSEGGSVYAHADEIDAWRNGLGREPEEAPADVPPASPPVSPSWTHRWWRVAVLILVCLPVGAMAGFYASRHQPDADTFVVHNGRLEARDARGRAIWTHTFGGAASAFSDTRRVTRIADLDADGLPEVLVPIRFADAGARATSTDALYVFSRDGQMKWVIKPTMAIDLAGVSVNGPWELIDIVIPKATMPRRVWVVYSRASGATSDTHRAKSPSFVVEMSPTGQSHVRYVQLGPIGAMASWTTPAGTFLAVGGGVETGDYASLVLMRDDDPPATFYGTGKLEDGGCTACPTGVVRRALLFPPTEIGRLASPGPMLAAADEYVPRLWLQYKEGESGGAIIVLNPDFSFESFRFAASHWGHHQKLERSGQLTHTGANCPEMRTPMTVTEWTQSNGWREWLFVPDSQDWR